MTTLLIVIAVIAYLAVGILFSAMVDALPGDGLLFDAGILVVLWPICVIACLLIAAICLLGVQAERLAKRINRR